MSSENLIQLASSMVKRPFYGNVGSSHPAHRHVDFALSQSDY